MPQGSRIASSGTASLSPTALDPRRACVVAERPRTLHPPEAGHCGRLPPHAGAFPRKEAHARAVYVSLELDRHPAKASKLSSLGSWTDRTYSGTYTFGAETGELAGQSAHLLYIDVTNATGEVENWVLQMGSPKLQGQLGGELAEYICQENNQFSIDLKDDFGNAFFDDVPTTEP